MTSEIRFRLTHGDLAIQHSLYQRAIDRHLRRERWSLRDNLACVVIAFAYVVPLMLFLTSDVGGLKPIVLYFTVAPWVVVSMAYYIARRRSMTHVAAQASEFVLRLEGSDLHLETGKLESTIRREAVKSVGSLKDHLALSLENGAVVLIPRRAFPCQEVESAWRNALTSEAT